MTDERVLADAAWAAPRHRVDAEGVPAGGVIAWQRATAFLVAAAAVIVLFTFQDEIPLDLLSDDELGRLLDKFADLPELEGHWVQALFTALSRRIPHRVLKFFIARLEAAAGHRGRCA